MNGIFQLQASLSYLTSAHRNLELIKLNPNLLKSVYFSIVKKWKLIKSEL